MGIFRKLFGDRESEEFGDSWLDTFCARYERAAKEEPYAPPADHLMAMWIGHFSCLPQRNAKYLMDSVIQQMACLHACLPPPDCGIALGLYMLAIEQPQVVAKHPRFESAYGRLMAEVGALVDREDFDGLNALFDRHNPNVISPSPFPIGGMESFERGKRLGLW